MFVKAAEYARVAGVTRETLRRWANDGKINFMRTPGGMRLYELPDATSVAEKEKIIYARVSSAKQKDDLERQIAFLCKDRPGHKVVSDVGSGINWKRRGLQTILGAAADGKIDEVVVASRDRLCRFAFELVDGVLQRHGVRLIVLESADQSPEQELADDLMSIVQVFCCRWNGKRRYAAADESKINQSTSSKRRKRDCAVLDTAGSQDSRRPSAPAGDNTDAGVGLQQESVEWTRSVRDIR
jgi:predicted site-specific integrase-resolvase